MAGKDWLLRLICSFQIYLLTKNLLTTLPQSHVFLAGVEGITIWKVRRPNWNGLGWAAKLTQEKKKNKPRGKYGHNWHSLCLNFMGRNLCMLSDNDATHDCGLEYAQEYD